MITKISINAVIISSANCVILCICSASYTSPTASYFVTELSSMTTPTTGITMDTLQASRMAPKIIINTMRIIVFFCFLSSKTFNFFKISRISVLRSNPGYSGSNPPVLSVSQVLFIRFFQNADPFILVVDLRILVPVHELISKSD